MRKVNTPPKEWELKRISSLGKFYKGSGITKMELVEQGHNAIRYGELYTKYHHKITNVRSFIPETVATNATKVLQGDILFAGSGETIDEIGKSATYQLEEDAYAGGDIIILRPKKDNSLFLSYFLNVGQARKKLRERGQGQSVVHIYKKDIQSLEFYLPPLPEQERIVAVLETWDEMVEKLKQKIEIKKQIKKGLAHELLTGRKRISSFSDKWPKNEIGNLLNYEQPTKYLVADTNYLSKGTPVLTAGKTFILGYTNDTTGVCDQGNVIIFDDFTTATKFVTFPFKVKSSAMKLLTPKNSDVNLRFIYERIQMINSDLGGHKRRYLSEFQYNSISLPSIEEQNAITDVLENADNEISSLKRKLALYLGQKKYLLNNLVTGAIRTPEDLLEKVK
ncbi:restriction endonuclease subunit S [candidate division WWE3 bacterium CG22_combo_CG10-13_8_21_14_all_39_12]|uniref:Restriction endonuclease subunit S n=1 Tax=candidate division WWE3 bacterium CG22_combo_CG10-13_8_21_14_all_39_12 TaxID=1975094 RepID=A0A2H0BFQ9_UNCKA|nr:MAG: restriction endonuclease subunit S [candidate division WWE3 bacterium CG22_combo_CG10-13_8_21_14_all_39_12]